MANPTKEPSAFVTGSDEKYVFVWSSDQPLEELRFPLKMDSERPQPGQKVQYVCTRPLSEVQYGGVLKKVDNPSPVIIQRDAGDFLVVAHVGFPPPGSNYCLRELAVADDYHIRVYCHSVELGTVVSFRNLDSDWQKIYQVHLKRFPKHCDWMIPKVSTMWHICNMQEVTDSARAAQISSLMPWNNTLFDDGYDIDANMIPLKSMAGLSVMDSDFDEQSTSQRPFMSSSNCALPQNPANLHQSTSHMTMPSAERFPLINIDDNSAQTGAPNCSLSDQWLAPAPQWATNAANVQSTVKQQTKQIIDLGDAETSSCKELSRRNGTNDFSDLVLDLKPRDVVPNFEAVRQCQPEQENAIQSGSSCSVFQENNETIILPQRSGSAVFSEFGLLIATLLSKTPPNRIWEAVQLKRMIFEMCANLQNDLMGGNV
uniref:Uncharacterized protein n=1 Tax=Globodera rostochiensis TaxID=31243 RepID=A0A914HYH8_GLORO